MRCATRRPESWIEISHHLKKVTLGNFLFKWPLNMNGLKNRYISKQPLVALESEFQKGHVKESVALEVYAGLEMVN